jgi:hypothetical protein
MCSEAKCKEKGGECQDKWFPRINGAPIIVLDLIPYPVLTVTGILIIRWQDLRLKACLTYDFPYDCFPVSH